MRPRSPQSQRAFTLIELVIAVVVLAALGAALAQVFITGAASSADPQIRAQARAIAEGYMEEILLKAYSEPEPGSNETPGGGVEGESRATYDDVWDYCDIGNNNNCTAGTEHPTNQNGDPMGGSNEPLKADYDVTVIIEGDDPTGSDPGPATIRVSVTGSGGLVDYTLVSQRADY
jgi:MSHA pilin protein MshD